MLELLKSSLENAPVIKFQDYDYFVFSIADGIPAIQPELFEEVINAMAEKVEGEYDKIVTAEAMGIHLAAGLSMKTGKPFTIIRKRKYNLPDEKEFEQVTGYSSRKMYINGLKRGDRIVLLDDLISTGGTLIGILRALDQMGVVVVDIIIVIDKGTGRSKVEEKFGVNIKTLVGIDIVDGQVRIREE
ncbi:MAG: adenine phosphoribosyltransferase [Candidatus Thermoplasmatota archaeon]|nr:adenine phosphoribosyltransferase [Euryarchaeota archaeon]MBU4032098.1 adenine phosphoribosyltransferase [Candidatus Thermoplasmatota archaeon]MBU4072287.1 adenine phosphoribosyltransferase [Candidatus Thermoplasmatota archaeon]MBU4144322.1 adenine phosphoribosyltransferase [Candidatus Thermoplasmatota archaeon]MBU4592588.1 adenine phosphoribosyltransferase [Candidatus Thermoplasmatota archaeon]